MASEFDRLAVKIEFLKQIIQLLSDDISRPEFVELEGQGRAFRFGEPKLKHFVFLHFARIVSGLNAALALAKLGYCQELAVILRTLYEFIFKIDYVSSGYFDPKLRSKVLQYLDEYFSDFSRASDRVDKDKSPRQKDINVALAGNYEWVMSISGLEADNADSAKLRRHLLSVYSNYVHGRYPEIMDMYGGRSVSIHAQGMAGTPKDNENYLQLEAVLKTTDLTIKNYVRRFGYHTAEGAHGKVRQWANDI